MLNSGASLTETSKHDEDEGRTAASPAKAKVIAVLLLAGVLPWLLSWAAEFGFGEARYVHEPLHESLELIGGCIAITVTMLLWMRARHEADSPHLLWVAAALVAMGLLDGAHAVVPFGVPWSWLRHTATLVGGVLFALIWLPLPAIVIRRKQLFMFMVVILAFLAAVGVGLRAALLPAPWGPGGYTFAAKFANALGGFGFIAAALFFLRRYIRGSQLDDLVFASQTMLFGNAALLFSFSHLWAADWWAWHGLRLLGHLVVLAAAYAMVVALYHRISSHADELEQRVEARTAEAHQQREWLRVTLNSIGDGVITSDREGRITFLNPVAQSLTGWPLAEALRQPFARVFQIINEQTRAPGEDLVTRVLHEKAVIELANHTALVTKDGREFAIEDSAAPIQDSAGIISGVVVVFHDVTEKRRTRDAARRLAAIVETSEDAILSKSPEGVITTWNKGAERLYGYTAAEAIGQPITLVMPPEHHGELEVLRQRILRGEAVQHYESLRVRKDGRRVEVSVTLSPLKDADGHITGASAIVRDISERQEAARRLQASEQRYRSLVTATSQIVWSTNAQGEVDDMPGWRALTGQSVEQVRGWGWSNALHPDDRERTKQVWSQAVKGRTLYDTEYRVRSHDGQYRYLAARGVPVLDGDGRIREWVGTCNDITARKQAEDEIRKLNESLEQRVLQRTAELQATNQELEAFTYSVSHDLRAPLRHLSGFSKLLLEEEAARLNESGRHYLDEIQAAARRMGQLVDDLLDLSRMSRKELHPQITGLNSLVEEVIRELSPEIDQREIEWKISKLPFADGDPALLKQVLTNLISNAVKFTRPRAPAVIEIGQLMVNEQPAIFVRDNGVGFSMRYAEKLFGIFQRLHRSEDFEGTGVGLALVQRIVHRHGGRVWAEAELDRGATFYFTLSSLGPQPSLNEVQNEIEVAG